MKKIAFVTSSEYPKIAEDDRILVAELETYGIRCIAAAWDDSKIDWTLFDLVFIRSCWNYHRAPEKFIQWIGTFQDGTVRMLNPPDLILWNLNKHYLKELQKKGISIPDTVWISGHDFIADKLHDILLRKNWSRAVLKPCVSASSFRTNVINLSMIKEKENGLFRDFVKGGMMLQEFIDTIPQEGEYSLVFFNGQFSHAVIKTAKPGDFRVQHEFGGNSASVKVTEEMVQSAEQIIAKLPATPLYARVDGAMVDQTFILMELELIEPVLFFKHSPRAVSNLAACLLKEV
jgi:glutathione synthase/RimK-type ligase-like ATP-grasp enzyme